MVHYIEAAFILSRFSADGSTLLPPWPEEALPSPGQGGRRAGVLRLSEPRQSFRHYGRGTPDAPRLNLTVPVKRGGNAALEPCRRTPGVYRYAANKLIYRLKLFLKK